MIKISENIRLLIRNRVFWYMISKYGTYFVQFLVLIFAAAKMGPYYYGIWGFILLIINYISIFNFGVPISMSILMVKYKEEIIISRRIETSSFLFMSFLSVLLLFITILYFTGGFELGTKYPIDSFLLVICIIGILTFYKQLCEKIYRLKHGLSEITISQAVIPLLLLFSLFFLSGISLLYAFVFSYLVGNIISLIVFGVRGLLSFEEKPQIEILKMVLKKGLYLFIYNFCFYLILISTRTIISISYSIEEFGLFTFAYTLADSVILLLDAIGYLIFPKLVDKFNTSNPKEIKNTFNIIQTNYITLIHCLMYLAFLFFPILLFFMPQYESGLRAIYLIAFTLMIYSNSYGYTTFLMAQGKEIVLSYIAIVSLMLNVVFALFIVHFKFPFDFVIIATMISYYVFTFLCVRVSRGIICLEKDILSSILDCFPIRLFIPYLIAFLIILSNTKILLFLPLVTFLIINYNGIKEIVLTIRKIVKKPEVVEINGF